MSLEWKGPSGKFQNFLGYFGVPIDIPEKEIQTIPWMTFILGLGMLLLHLLMTTQHPESTQSQLGYDASEPFRYFGLTVFSTNFIHRGWFHLISNVYFFWILSDNIEDDLGFIGYLSFLCVISILSAGIETWLGIPSDIPRMGVSGMIMAMLIYYALRFPKARMGYAFSNLHVLFKNPRNPNGEFKLRWFRVPIWLTAIIYVLLDLVYSLIFDRMHLNRTAYSVHIGGALAGVLFWYGVRFWRDLNPKLDFA